MDSTKIREDKMKKNGEMQWNDNLFNSSGQVYIPVHNLKKITELKKMYLQQQVESLQLQLQSTLKELTNLYENGLVAPDKIIIRANNHINDSVNSKCQYCHQNYQPFAKEFMVEPNLCGNCFEYFTENKKFKITVENK